MCNSGLANDDCGVCDGPGAVYECGCSDIADGTCDCDGNVEDECNVCGGDGPEEFYNCDGDFVGVNVQVIHSSADPTVDVYVNGAMAVEGFEYRQATPVLTLPSSFLYLLISPLFSLA